MKTAGLAAAALLAAMSLAAQTPEAVEATGCVFHEGDDPRWAQPDFDDRDWSRTPPDVQAEQYTIAGGSMAAHTSVYLWQRCRLNLTPLAAAKPLFVILRTPLAWRLYLNGQARGTWGDPDTGRIRSDVVQGVPIPADIAADDDLLVAIRFTRGPYRLSAGQTPLAGPAWAVELERGRLLRDAARTDLPNIAAVPVFVIIGVTLLILWWSGREQRETLWLGLLTLTGAGGTAGIATLLHLGVPVEVQFGIRCAGEILITYASVFFFFALARRPLPRLWLWIATFSSLQWLVQYIALAIPGVAAHWFVWRMYWEPHALLFWMCVRFVTYLAAFHAFWPVWKLRSGERLEQIMSLVFSVAQMLHLVRFIPSVSQAALRGVSAISYAASFAPLFVFLYVLAGRFRSMTAEREDLRAEMKSAREIQRMLVPESMDIASPFAFDAAYLPAREVGGDFYQSLPSADGSLLVVAGDVSGKGLNAAMVVATVVGALRNESSRSPSVVLANLNRGLVGRLRGGFVTCICAILQPDGQSRIANAGHLLPYLEGREVEVDSGLPLGITADVTYPESEVSLGGETLTFVSDGVVEATNTKGELFGFDRALRISGKTAAEIAETARKWGQADDITVVTVRRRAAGIAI